MYREYIGLEGIHFIESILV